MVEEPIPLTSRLTARIGRDSPRPDRADVAAALERLHLGTWFATQTPDGRERVLAATFVLVRVVPARLAESIRIAEGDWRDARVWTGLAQPD